MEALHYLTGLAQPATLGVSVALDLRTLDVTREPIAKHRTARVCRDVT